MKYQLYIGKKSILCCEICSFSGTSSWMSVTQVCLCLYELNINQLSGLLSLPLPMYDKFVCLFGVLRRFQHCTGHITTGSWKGRGNQYIEFARVHV